jgi:hypothetical protein
MKVFFQYCPAISGSSIIISILVRILLWRQTIGFLLLDVAFILAFAGGTMAVINYIVNKTNKNTWGNSILAILLWFFGLAITTIVKF